VHTRRAHTRRCGAVRRDESHGPGGVVAKRLDSLYRPGIRSRAWTKTKHWQERTFALLGWLPPEEWRGDRGCVVLGLRTPNGIAVSGAVESGYDRELVDRLPELSRGQLRELQNPGRVWTEGAPLVGQVKFLEWSPAGGLRHAVLVAVFERGAPRRKTRPRHASRG
jgi:bifunctional non-homologous end joining protein LigD